jgi:hypothetical protein
MAFAALKEAVAQAVSGRARPGGSAAPSAKLHRRGYRKVTPSLNSFFNAAG